MAIEAPASIVKLGIVGGLGNIGGTHWHASEGNPNLSLARIADRLVKDPDSLALQYPGIKFSSANGDIYKDPQLDAVVLAIPTPDHPKETIAALQAGKHVLCEKPMALDPKNAKEMLSVADRSERVLHIGLVLHHDPVYLELSNRLNHDDVGRVTEVSAWRKTPRPGSAWFLRENGNGELLSGGTLYDLGNHNVDILRRQFGPVRMVMYTGSYDPEVMHLDAKANIEFRSGVVASIHESWMFEQGGDDGIEIRGSKGMMRYSGREGKRLTIVKNGFKTIVDCPDPERCGRKFDAYSAQLDAFAKAVKFMNLDRANPYGAIEGLEVLQAIKQSFSLGLGIYMD